MIEEIAGQVRILIPRLGVSFLIFLAFWFAAKILRRVILHLGKRSQHNQDILILLGQIADTAIYIFGVITALGTLGINVSALVAGLGLTGFALGFAFHDALSNILAGVLILFYRPFRRGDFISVTGFTGRVIEINLRYTVLQKEKEKILIPNASLFTNVVSVIEEPS